MNPVYYWDINGTLNSVNASTTGRVNALHGILFCRKEVPISIQGTPGKYFWHTLIDTYIALFLADDGVMICGSDGA